MFEPNKNPNNQERLDNPESQIRWFGLFMLDLFMLGLVMFGLIL